MAKLARSSGWRMYFLLSAILFFVSLCFLLLFVILTPAHNTSRTHPTSFNIPPIPLVEKPPLEIIIRSNEKETVRWWGGEIIRPAPVPLDKKKYPDYLNLYDVVTKWNPDIPDPPVEFRETLAHFNYSCPRERAMAEEYRNAELPFKVYNVPQVDMLGVKWSDEYLSQEFKKMGSVHVERSDSNHFMYWTLKGGREPENYTPPTEIINDMHFDEWVKLARSADRLRLSNTSEHFYLMSSSAAGDRGRVFISRDLSLFSTPDPNFFITNPAANKGVQCRLAMRGVISEAHYDSGRNMIAMITGVKRYILNPPEACEALALIKDIDHPSYRHSVIDWSDPEQAKVFADVKAIDTLVRAGEVLYIPTGWNHYIIALMYSMQCNSRSGSPPNGEGLEQIEKCMGRKFPRTNGLRKHRGRNGK